MKNIEDIVIFWFRHDLRLQDNHGLYASLRLGLPVIAIYIFDVNILRDFTGPINHKISFIWSRLTTLQETLRNVQSRILIYHEKPIKVFELLLEKYNIKAVFCNQEYEPYEIERDNEIEKALNNKGISFIKLQDKIVINFDRIKNTENKPYQVYTSFKKKWLRLFSSENIPYYDSENYLKNLYRNISKCNKEISNLLDIGYKFIKLDFPNDEIPKEKIKNYHLTRDYPGIDGTTRLGIHFRYGTVSIRQAVAIAKELNPTWLNELIWREFFIYLMYNFPQTCEKSFRPWIEPEWQDSEELFDLWCSGQTSFPIIDAGMRQLVQTGFIHNRIRMICANFLTKILRIHWKKGERFFVKHLLDYDLALNVGNWQWAAGVGVDAAPYYRIFNPTIQQKKFDPNYIYCKNWLSEKELTKAQPIIDFNLSKYIYIESVRNNSKTIKKT